MKNFTKKEIMELSTEKDLQVNNFHGKRIYKTQIDTNFIQLADQIFPLQSQIDQLCVDSSS